MNRFSRRAALVGTFCMTTLLLACGSSIAAEGSLDFVIYASHADMRYANTLQDLLSDASQEKANTKIVQSLEAAAASDADVVILFLTRTKEKIADEVLEKLKKKKVLGVDYGSAQLFGLLGLSINGGACAHFSSNAPKLQTPPCELLGERAAEAPFAPYQGAAGGDNFGMYIPAKSELAKHLDVVARCVGDENYAPIVRQGNFVMVGYSGLPTEWSQSYRALFTDVARQLRARERESFRAADLPITAPGIYFYELAKGRSRDDLPRREHYLRFEKPTRFTATLIHDESDNMMMIFMGEKDRQHWTRKDSRNGDPLTITVDITEEDIKKNGDRLWSLAITNFDAQHAPHCTLHIDYVDADEE